MSTEAPVAPAEKKDEGVWVEETVKVLSMCPADGWDAAFKDPDKTLWRGRLAIWVNKRIQNVKFEKGREIYREQKTQDVIRGYFATDMGLSDAEEEDNFIGYFHQSDPDDMIKQMAGIAEPEAKTP